MLHALVCQRVLDLRRRHRDTVDEQREVERVLTLAVGKLPDDRQTVCLVAGKQLIECPCHASRFFATGKIGEDALARLGGRPHAYFMTSQGARFVDRLVSGIAHESKVGAASLTEFVSRQVAKDVELMAEGRIDGAVWHFFRSPITGEIGPSAPLYELLEQNGIGIVIHW